MISCLHSCLRRPPLTAFVNVEATTCEASVSLDMTWLNAPLEKLSRALCTETAFCIPLPSRRHVGLYSLFAPAVRRHFAVDGWKRAPPEAIMSHIDCIQPGVFLYAKTDPNGSKTFGITVIRECHLERMLMFNLQNFLLQPDNYRIYVDWPCSWRSLSITVI
ncbi:hypothetical protein BDR04DRAFT_1087992 [Suillus decipiens]|nr:hypothetical protein BDR04DRAFT_1087992 [Suillus decipiens]